jgi:hypothetical protein
MDYIQFLIMFLTFIGVFIWNRTENRADLRHMDAKLESNRALCQEMYKGIQEEMKDFHTRLALQDQEFKIKMMQIAERKK